MSLLLLASETVTTIPFVPPKLTLIFALSILNSVFSKSLTFNFVARHRNCGLKILPTVVNGILSMILIILGHAGRSFINFFA